MYFKLYCPGKQDANHWPECGSLRGQPAKSIKLSSKVILGEDSRQDFC